MSRLSGEINQTINLESLWRKAAEMLSSREWPDLEKAVQEKADQRRIADRVYKLEYKERVAMARMRLINKAGPKVRPFKPLWATDDRFDKEAINRQAQENVSQAHRGDLARIDRDEARAIEQLIDSCEKSRDFREMPKRDFNRAADRRSGIERRIRKRS